MSRPAYRGIVTREETEAIERLDHLWDLVAGKHSPLFPSFLNALNEYRDAVRRAATKEAEWASETPRR